MSTSLKGRPVVLGTLKKYRKGPVAGELCTRQVSDRVFDAMDGWAPTAAAAATLPAQQKLPLLADHERSDRTPATMAAEAAAYRALARAGAAEAAHTPAAHTFARFTIAVQHGF